MSDASQQVRLKRLLSRCALADAAAFDALYKETAPKLFGVLLRILKRQDWAEDVLQDTFVRIWREAGSYRPDKGAALTWMTSIGRYRAIDILRRYRVDFGLDEDDRQGDPSLTDYDPPVVRGATETSSLQHCLQELQQQQRTAIVMSYCEGYTHQELSARLAAPMGTIKSWIRRGLESLRKCLEP